jgi:hypothetical protein
MTRKVIALFDEYQSRENGKHVIRNMKRTLDTTSETAHRAGQLERSEGAP